jgi:hypothetical protein
MKILDISIKNLKVVARNKAYFAVLFLCPILLILISGALLNSNDYDNIGIGIINEALDYEIDLSNVKNPYFYDSVNDCLYDLTNSKVSVCMHVREIEGRNKISIYLDNTKKAIQYYSQQFILQQVLDQQTDLFKQTSTDVSTQLTVYTNSIDDAILELEEVSLELDSQEQTLVNYKGDLAILREDFDEAYIPLKESEADIIRIRQDFTRVNQNLGGNISDFRQTREDILNQIQFIQIYLAPPTLSQSEYDYIMASLIPIEQDLQDLEYILDDLEEIQKSSQDIIDYLNILENLISKLDSIKETLDNLDNDLDESIVRIQNSKIRVDNFRVELESGSSSLKRLANDEGIDDFSIDFFNSFPVGEDPTFLVFPLLVSIIITFTSLVLSNMFILKQINMDSYFRDLISPTNDFTFMLSDYIVNLFFISIQAVVLFLLGNILFDVYFSSFGIFVFGIILTASIFIFIGMSIAYLIRAQSFSMLVTVFLLILILILSNLISPMVLASPLVNTIINLNPFVLLLGVLKGVLLLENGFSELKSSFLVLGVFLLVTIIFAYFSKKVCRRNFMR